MNVISTQRRKEYGLRIALGADRTEILRMVLREGARLTLAGTAIGLVGALITGQLLRGFLFGSRLHRPVDASRRLRNAERGRRRGQPGPRVEGGARRARSSSYARNELGGRWQTEPRQRRHSRLPEEPEESSRGDSASPS